MTDDVSLSAAARQLIQRLFAHPDHFGEWLGYEIQTMKSGNVVLSLPIETRHTSPSGAAHGGVIASLVDAAMGFALFTQLKEGLRCSTIEFKINYFSPVQPGEKIYARASIKFQGKSHAVIECHVYREHEARKDIAMAMGTYNIYPV